MNSNLCKAIYTLFATANTFNTATAGKMEYGRAQEGWTDNFATYQVIGIDQDDYFASEIDNVLFQVNVFSTVRATCWDLFDKCKTLFDGKYLTVTGASAPLRITRGSQVPPIWNERENFYQATINFEVMHY